MKMFNFIPFIKHFFYFSCSRFKCYSKISDEEKSQIFDQFYALESKNEQDSYLTGKIKQKKLPKYINFILGLISYHIPKQRRSRKNIVLRDVPLIESEDEDGGSSHDNVP